MQRLAVLPALLLAACTTVPRGPGLMALPGTGRNFDEFRADERDCRSYADAQVGDATADGVAADSGVRSAALGTAVGGVAGAMIDGSRGAATGAGAGLLMGGLAGTAAGSRSAHALQERYDHAYVQCMYAKGHKVPVMGRFTEQRSRPRPALPPPPRRPAR